MVRLCALAGRLTAGKTAAADAMAAANAANHSVLLAATQGSQCSRTCPGKHLARCKASCFQCEISAHGGWCVCAGWLGGDGGSHDAPPARQLSDTTCLRLGLNAVYRFDAFSKQVVPWNVMADMWILLCFTRLCRRADTRLKG